MDSAIRTFFALVPDDGLRERLAKLANEVAELCGGRATRATNVHLTLLYIGETPQTLLPVIKRVADAVRVKSFAIDFDEIGTWKKSDVAWIAPSAPPVELTALHRQLAAGLTAQKTGFDPKPYSPHLTLARRISKRFEAPSFDALTWNVSSFDLLQSISDGGGVRYSSLASWPCR